jgi:uncharacterized protein (DUF1330 family)
MLVDIEAECNLPLVIDLTTSLVLNESHFLTSSNMKYYFSAQIKIVNQDEYQKYLDKIDDIFSRYNGEYLAIDESPELLEGDWHYTKSVLIKFNSKQDFENWYYSEDYQSILKYRLKASKSDTILIEGID